MGQNFVWDGKLSEPGGSSNKKGPVTYGFEARVGEGDLSDLGAEYRIGISVMSCLTDILRTLITNSKHF